MGLQINKRYCPYYNKSKRNDNLTRRIQDSQEYGLRINRSKTEIMIVNRFNNNKLKLNEISGVEVIDHFTYLGSSDNKAGCERED